MKYFIIAGEASGDLHGAGLVAGLMQSDPTASIRCWGGGLMEGEGATVLKHYRELAFMGFVEVVKNLPEILGNFKACKSQILDFQPDAIILIDYPGFNLRMATWAEKAGLKVYYYISPQLWAWHSSRVNIVKAAVRKMFVIFPFEVDFYQKRGVDAVFVGHPLSGVGLRPPAGAELFHQRNGLDPSRPILALLPGSRKQEISRILPVMLSTAAQCTDCQAVIAGAPSMGRSFYEPYLREFPAVCWVENQTYPLLANARAAMVTSGTATLEVALLKVPQVVCYKAGQVSYALAKRLINQDLHFISIVNLIAGRGVVKELIQQDLTAENLLHHLRQIMYHSDERSAILAGYEDVAALLGTPGAGLRTAKLILADLSGLS